VEEPQTSLDFWIFVEDALMNCVEGHRDESVSH
jgi:hypothetical protein